MASTQLFIVFIVLFATFPVIVPSSINAITPQKPGPKPPAQALLFCEPGLKPIVSHHLGPARLGQAWLPASGQACTTLTLTLQLRYICKPCKGMGWTGAGTVLPSPTCIVPVWNPKHSLNTMRNYQSSTKSITYINLFK